MRSLILLIVILSLLLTSCVNNDRVYKGTSVENEKSYRTIQRQTSSNVQKFKRVALVIGNNDYEEAPLSNAISDARAMRDFLKSKNFKVVYAENTVEKVMRNKIDTFLSSLDEKSVGFVYYSGHGIQEYSNRERRVTNYLIPTDNSKLKGITDLDYYAISLNYLLDTLAEKQNALNVVLLDACRSPFKAFSRSSDRGLVPSNAEGVFIAYSTASGAKALDDGLFRKTFIKYAQQPLKLVDIFENVKMDVYSITKQTPFTSNGKRGLFYFTEPKLIIPTLNQEAANVQNSIREEDRFYIKSGSFFGEISPIYLNGISKHRYPYMIQKVRQGDRIVRRVFIGPFYSFNSATKALVVIRRKINEFAYIVTGVR